ncbi:MAG: hypothetical protein V1823_02900 [Chloroflexota bacterium]
MNRVVVAQDMKPEISLGATYLGDNRSHFLVWAPLAERVVLRLLGNHHIPDSQASVCRRRRVK